MKRITLALAATLLIAPTLAGAQTVVYRHELRQHVFVPTDNANRPTMVARGSDADEIARHEAMAQVYRGTKMAQAAAHCDRAVSEARKSIRKNF